MLVGVAASRTKTFRNQNHRFQSKFVYCKLFGVYAGVIFPWLLLQGAPRATLLILLNLNFRKTNKFEACPNCETLQVVAPCDLECHKLS